MWRNDYTVYWKHSDQKSILYLKKTIKTFLYNLYEPTLLVWLLIYRGSHVQLTEILFVKVSFVNIENTSKTKHNHPNSLKNISKHL